MIGHKGSGKTCYLYAMYSQMAFGVNGFTFMPDDFDKALQLENGWSTIVDEHKWPEGTNESNDFVFNCSYALRQLIDFTWHDYRGGILKEGSQSSDYPKFREKLSNSGTLIICISAEIVKGLLKNDHGAESFVRIYNQLLQQYVKDHARTVPIAITITKSDLLEDEDFPKAIVILKRLLGFLFEKNGNWMVMVVAVSLGENLTTEKDKPITGTISPAHIHLPVMFAIYSTFNQLLFEKEIQSKKIEDKYRIESNKSPLQKFWNGADTVSILNQLETNKADLEAIKTDLNRIVNELRKDTCVLFFNGEKL